MTSDHPNGGAFYRYPEIIALLMDRELRRDTMARLPHGLEERTVLKDIDREYTLSEVAIITRAAPARILGLKHKGHLGAGADADITIYAPDKDIRRMFERPRWVIKGGVVAAEDGDIQKEVFGETFFVEPGFDQNSLPGIKDWFEEHYTISFSNYPVDTHYVDQPHVVPCDS